MNFVVTKVISGQTKARSLIRYLVTGGLTLLLVVLPGLMAVNEPAINFLKRAGLTIVIILATPLVEQKRWGRRYLWILVALWGLGFISYHLFRVGIGAWLIAAGWLSALLFLGRWLSSARFSNRIIKLGWLMSLWGGLALLAGGGLALYNAVLLKFAEEEFFTLATAIYFSIFWLILSLSCYLIFGQTTFLLKPTRPPKFLLLVSGVAGLIFGGILVSWLTVQYQRSFFPEMAPIYADISEDKPFLCETLDPGPQQISSNQLQEQLIALLTAIPDKDTLTLGSLALYTGEPAYALGFRKSLLQEAEESFYTSPANSVKWGQFEAALRVHQLDLINQKFPDLFSPEDKQTLKSWFTQINQRAMTTEWVDWLYAIAYGRRPAGPYENQEIGVGLLAVLTNTGLAAPDLSERNKDYLTNNALGWQDLFRNTDDAYMYQGVWLSNAWWIYNYERAAGLSTPIAEQNMRLSFLWLLALALPDGEKLSYNVHGSSSMVEYYLAGAMLLQDPRLVWLASKSLARPGNQAKYFLPSGIHFSRLDLPEAKPPDIGSCLIFGNSGVPTAKGPLAPDKVVLRDGWNDDSMYALLNLRFSGWHRYKATNTLTLLYQDGPLVTEKWTSDAFSWLPEGRRAFRDKRVPRENLNGLLLPKSGLSQVLWVLSGIGSRWMQNPPAYAEVEEFFSTELIDGSRTIISNWNSWRHERTIYLIHEGLIIVIDEASTDTGSGPATIVWHLKGSGQLEKNGLRLDNDQRAARLVWSERAGATMKLSPEISNDHTLRNPDWELLFVSPDPKRLNLATALLTGDRTEGEISLTFIDERQGLSAVWQNDLKSVSLLHNSSGSYLDYAGLATDGTTLVLAEDGARGEKHLCYTDGQTFSITSLSLPDQILTETGDSLPVGMTWDFEDGRLTINLATDYGAGCLIVR